MTAADFTRDQLRHYNALAGSTQMTAFTERMRLDSPAIRLVREFGNYCIAHRDEWAREDAEAGK